VTQYLVNFSFEDNYVLLSESADDLQSITHFAQHNKTVWNEHISIKI